MPADGMHVPCHLFCRPINIWPNITEKTKTKIETKNKNLTKTKHFKTIITKLY